MNSPKNPAIHPEWRSIDDLPPQADEDEEFETRCVVVWQDAEHESDQGVEVTNLAHIRDGDFHQGRYLNPVWRTVMDAPVFTRTTLTNIEDHNRKQQTAPPTYPRPNGIACPKCGSEMHDLNGNILTSIPPKKAVACPDCGHHDFALA